jgi:hypothetical protein
MPKLDKLKYFVLPLLFFVLYLILSFNSRLATDDYYFIGDIKNHGMFEQVWFQYMNWSGRYTATMAANFFYNFFELKQEYYFTLPLLSFSLLIFGMFFLLKQIVDKLNLVCKKPTVVWIAFLFCSFLFFLSFDVGESWFWYCGYSSYLWSIIALVWGLYFLLVNGFYSIVLASFCFIYVGAASEIYSSIIGLCYTIFFVYAYRYNKSIIENKQFRYKLIFVYTCFAIAFILFLVAPGNYLRDGLFPEHQLGRAIFITAKSFIKFCVFYLPSKLIYILSFSGMFYVSGNTFSSNVSSVITFRAIAKYSTLILLILLLVFYLLVAYIMVETGPPRVLFFVSFLVCSYIFVLSFFAGALQIFKKKNSVIRLASFVLLLLTLVFTLFNQTVITSKYANSHDERVKHILYLKEVIKKDSLVFLKPLAPSGMLYSAEITADTSHFTNKELKLGFDLPFYLAVEKK